MNNPGEAYGQPVPSTEPAVPTGARWTFPAQELLFGLRTGGAGTTGAVAPVESVFSRRLVQRPESAERRLNRTHNTPAATVARAAVADVAETWERLARPTVSPQGFDPAMTELLPEPARRWLTHVIAPGRPVARAAIVGMRGHIRLGRWIGFQAVQVLAPPAGFIWAARARWGPLWIGGYDRYSDATGEMRWRLFNRIPVISATGPDINRSAAGRVALDALLVPSTWLQEAVTWRTAENDDTVVAEWHVDDQTLPVTLTVGPDGALCSLTMPRWAQPSGHPWDEYPFGGSLADETDFDGIKLSRTIRAGYFYGTDNWDSPAGEFFRAEITQARFL